MVVANASGPGPIPLCPLVPGRAVVLFNPFPDRSSWLGARRTYVGASEVAAVLGLSPFEGPLSVWARKTGRIGATDDTPEMAIGRALEPVCLRLAEEELGVDILGVPEVLGHPESMRLATNLDGAIFDKTLGLYRAVVEAKSSGAYARRAWDEFRSTRRPVPDTITEAYWVQVQAQLAVTGLQHGYLSAIVDREHVLVEVEADERFHGFILEQIDRFWRHHVEADTPPPVRLASEAEAVRKIWSASSAGKSVALPHLGSKAKDLIDAKARLRHLEEEVCHLEATIQHEMKDAESAEMDGVTATWPTYTRTTIDVVRLRSERPEIASEFTKETAYRRFTVKERERGDD